MITDYRKRFNEAFSTEKYDAFKQAVAADFDYMPTFRMAETPLFVDESLKKQLIDACEQVIDFIKNPDFKAQTQRALELNKEVPNETEHTEFLAIDFGICEENGAVVPKLIEVQGFPSLFNFQIEIFEKFKSVYPFLSELTPFFNNISNEEYYEILGKVILGNHAPEEVMLLEIEPEKQNTKIDFYYCARQFGIKILCVTEVIKQGNQLYYNENGDLKPIKRIYNRVIFDELDVRTDLKLNFSFTEDLAVEWAGHPNWFFRISKFILPYLKGTYFIETQLLSEIEEIPADLENYVLKPLFSFSGSGVVFHVTKADIDAVVDKDLYILQKKVHYKPVVQSPDGLVKAEIRVLCLWPNGADRPTLLCNLVRLSRGEMIGVKFNKDKDWVGGTLGLFTK
ncbi:hypothetical protein [Flavobacterium sp.]|uniref:hypothetical protein n=1 Tax=Flavobacterium sp. TaxID=239 RepID=UPI002638275A|nr:hypothetical protein [Flavobacterium sp.]